MVAFVSLRRLAIFAWFPVLALLRIMVPMFCRLAEQSYFSCLNRSGRQEQRHNANIKQLAAFTLPSICPLLRARCPFNMVLGTFKPSFLLDQLRPYFRRFLGQYLGWHLQSRGRRYFHHLKQYRYQWHHLPLPHQRPQH